jgi:hypothetical protein
MNARTAPHIFSAPVTGTLLYAGFQQTDTLQLDLYGEEPDEEGGYTVTGVTVSGHNVDISELFSADQLNDMSEWLQFKDDTNPTLRDHAMGAKHRAMRGPY